MKWVGAHVSIGGGVDRAPANAAAIGAKAFGMFTKNQRQWHAPDYATATIDSFRKAMEDNGYKPEQVLAHDGYLINLANPDPDARKKSLDAFIDEMRRCEQLGLDRLNFHPGSHLRQIAPSQGLRWVAEGINAAHSKTKDVAAVIENTAGQGSNLGSTFEEIAEIIAAVEDKKRIGVCLDTCHLFTSGYDIRTPETYAKTLSAFDRIIGLKYLKGMHLNDSKPDLASHVDRHASLGKGFLGMECFALVMNDKRLDEIPLILETPDEEIWPEEIASLYEMIRPVSRTRSR